MSTQKVRHFSIKDLPFGYDNIFVVCTRDSFILTDDMLPDGFEHCTIGDSLRLKCCYKVGRLRSGRAPYSDSNCHPINFCPTFQYQGPGLDVTFFSLIKF